MKILKPRGLQFTRQLSNNHHSISDGVHQPGSHRRGMPPPCVRRHRRLAYRSSCTSPGVVSIMPAQLRGSQPFTNLASKAQSEGKRLQVLSKSAEDHLSLHIPRNNSDAFQPTLFSCRVQHGSTKLSHSSFKTLFATKRFLPTTQPEEGVNCSEASWVKHGSQVCSSSAAAATTAGGSNLAVGYE